MRGVWPRDFPPGELKFVPNAAIRIGTHSWIGPALVRAKDVRPVETKDGKRVRRDESGRYARKDASKTGEVVFALIKRATIRARPYLVFDEAAKNFLFSELDAMFKGAVKK